MLNIILHVQVLLYLATDCLMYRGFCTIVFHCSGVAIQLVYTLGSVLIKEVSIQYMYIDFSINVCTCTCVLGIT